MAMVKAKDGAELYYQDWGSGPVVTFSHGWPLNADAWDGQMHFLAQYGYRVVAHDRRGHLAIPFDGANRPGAQVSQGLLDQFWLWSMQAGQWNAYESIKAFSETDFTEDLRKIDVPVLLLQGEDDQIVPIHDSSKKSATLIPNATGIYFPNAPHGITATHQDQVNTALLKFLRS